MPTQAAGTGQFYGFICTQCKKGFTVPVSQYDRAQGVACPHCGHHWMPDAVPGAGRSEHRPVQVG